MERRARQIAAALAAVSALMAEEQAATRVRIRRAQSAEGPSPWALAGRLQLMNTRIGSQRG